MATSVGSTARCCANLQTALDKSCIAPDATRQKHGLLQGLMSPANTDGFTQVQLNSFFGKGIPGTDDCKVEIEYEQPDCVAAGAVALDICDSQTSVGDTRGYLEQSVTGIASRGGTFTLDEFDCLCERPDERLAKTVKRLARSVNAQVESQMVTRVLAEMGNYADGTDSADPLVTRLVNIIGDNSINAAAWTKIKSEYRQQFACDMPIIVGGELLAQYDDIRMAGLGVDAIGAQGSQAGLTDKFIDYPMDAIVNTALGTVGDSYAFTWHPGAMQLLDYYENVGSKEYFFEKSTRTVIDVDGIKYDWYLMFDECPNPLWKFVLTKRFDLFSIPAAAYSACFDFTGKVLYKLGCGENAC